MVSKMVFAGIAAASLVGCAQVPRASVELSATVGRDIAGQHNAHRATVELLFRRMRDDINRFVDDVYAPHQISAVMNHQWALSNSASAADRNSSLLPVLRAAFEPDADPVTQRNAIDAIELLLTEVQLSIESLRSDLLAEVAVQERQVLGELDRSYRQIHYANSIVTGYLASIVQVRDLQNDALSAAGAPALGERVSEAVASVATAVSRIVGGAEVLESGVDSMLDLAAELEAAIRLSEDALLIPDEKQTGGP
jgi:hypothetical protein